MPPRPLTPFPRYRDVIFLATVRPRTLWNSSKRASAFSADPSPHTHPCHIIQAPSFRRLSHDYCLIWFQALDHLSIRLPLDIYRLHIPVPLSQSPRPALSTVLLVLVYPPSPSAISLSLSQYPSCTPQLPSFFTPLSLRPTFVIGLSVMDIYPP